VNKSRRMRWTGHVAQIRKGRVAQRVFSGETCKRQLERSRRRWEDNISLDGKEIGSDIRVKGKAIPLQAWTSPEGSRSLRVPDFKTVGT
jgi:hypothetical protein